MRHVSTRGDARPLGFRDVLLAGLAPDGGLYLPESWPRLGEGEIAGFAGRPFAEVSARVLRLFAGDEVAPAVLARFAAESAASFAHPATTPLVQIGPELFLLELHHGPTLAFKDVAMQVLARLMDHALAERGRRATIVVATSGDTGGAAVEAFAGRSSVDLFVLFPDGRVSEVQRRQMTTVDAPNVHALAVDGTFDDAQAIVKGLFARSAFRDEVGLAAVNSINWARVVAQVPYYLAAAAALGGPARAPSFVVPTGNFGDVFAGMVAKRIGLPVARLAAATNANDILPRTLSSGRYEMRPVVPTSSPSMDIVVSSNFERLLFEAEGRDGTVVRRHMAGLAQSGVFSVEPAAMAAIRGGLDAVSVEEDEVAATIRAVRRETDVLIDPHTAVAVAAARRLALPGPVVALATAHPAKFPDAVEAACGERPALPARLEGLMGRTERFARVANDVVAVERFVRGRARAVGSAA